MLPIEAKVLHLAESLGSSTVGADAAKPAPQTVYELAAIDNIRWRYRPTRVLFDAEIGFPSGEIVTLGASLFGSQEELKGILGTIRNGERTLMLGAVSWLDAERPWLSLKNRIIHSDELDRPQVVYPKGKQPNWPPGARDYRAGALWLMQEVAARSPTPEEERTLTDALVVLHEPQSESAFLRARSRLHDTLGEARLAFIAETHARQLETSPRRLHTNADAIGAILWPRPGGTGRMTADQCRAIEEILRDLTGARRMWRVLMGDVGSGKTLVYLTVAATLAAAGWRVRVLEPTKTLTGQVRGVLEDYFITPGLISRETAERILIDTTTMLHADLPPADLLIVDEQQKFSVDQKIEAAAGAHILEVSATLIPRTGALVASGLYPVSRLNTAPVARRIETTLFTHTERIALYRRAQWWLAENPGRAMLVLYPERDAAGGAADRRGAIHAAESWRKVAPTVLAHGRMDPEQVEAAIGNISAGTASILVTTTICEVGLDLAELGAILVAHAERFGLSTLHQIRGRVARAGGDGECWISLGPGVDEDHRAWGRLNAFTRTTRGEEIGEIDLAGRGEGDLSAAGDPDQHGLGLDISGLALAQWFSDHQVRVRTAFEAAGVAGQARAILRAVSENSG